MKTVSVVTTPYVPILPVLLAFGVAAAFWAFEHFVMRTRTSRRERAVYALIVLAVAGVVSVGTGLTQHRDHDVTSSVESAYGTTLHELPADFGTTRDGTLYLTDSGSVLYVSDPENGSVHVVAVNAITPTHDKK